VAGGAETPTAAQMFVSTLTSIAHRETANTSASGK